LLKGCGLPIRKCKTRTLKAAQWRHPASVGFVVLVAVSEGFGRWLKEAADFCVVRLVEHVLVGGGCEKVDQCLTFSYFVDLGLSESEGSVCVLFHRLARR